MRGQRMNLGVLVSRRRVGIALALVCTGAWSLQGTSGQPLSGLLHAQESMNSQSQLQFELADHYSGLGMREEAKGLYTKLLSEPTTPPGLKRRAYQKLVLQSSQEHLPLNRFFLRPVQRIVIDPVVPWLAPLTLLGLLVAVLWQPLRMLRRRIGKHKIAIHLHVPDEILQMYFVDSIRYFQDLFQRFSRMRFSDDSAAKAPFVVQTWNQRVGGLVEDLVTSASGRLLARLISRLDIARFSVTGSIIVLKSGNAGILIRLEQDGEILEIWNRTCLSQQVHVALKDLAYEVMLNCRRRRNEV